MLKKIYQELVKIRKELQAIRRDLELKSETDESKGALRLSKTRNQDVCKKHSGKAMTAVSAVPNALPSTTW